MSSQSTTDGKMTLTITFDVGTDLDKAQVLVQNRVAIAMPRLPDEVQRIGVTTDKTSPDLMMVVHLVSPDWRSTSSTSATTRSSRFATSSRASRASADVSVFGAREYSMRVWLDPDRLASGRN